LTSRECRAVAGSHFHLVNGSRAGRRRRHELRPMVDGDDLDEGAIGVVSIDDAIWRHDQLADRRVVILRDNATPLWVSAEATDLRTEAPDHAGGRRARVLGDVIMNSP
jgi:hypothetical protein